jgi:D-serine deaminase-like pyridoxal phosphate-dependent protein
MSTFGDDRRVSLWLRFRTILPARSGSLHGRRARVIGRRCAPSFWRIVQHRPATLAPMRIAELRTPAALVDLDRLERNTSHMAGRMRRLGVRLRPHVKTHKTLEIARLQVGGHFGGITVSTLAEAAFFAAGGFDDITYAVPIAPAKLDEAAELSAGIERLSVLVEHPDTAAAVEACAAGRGQRLAVFLEVDCGGHRSGVDPGREESVELAARIAASPHLDFRGILTHAGQAYRCRSATGIRAAAEQERAVMVSFAERLRGAHVPVVEVSVGSTPTMAVIEDLTGVTEARPGNYAFFDATQAAIGSCTLNDVAFTVLVSVIARHPERRELVVDGGALALSSDVGPVHVDPACGFGVVLDVSGAPRAGWRVVSLSQEHGVLRATAPVPPERFSVGSLLRIVPNHSCPAAALFDRYFVVRGGEVVDEWRPVRGW